MQPMVWLKRISYFFVALIVTYSVGRLYVVTTTSIVDGERLPYLQMLGKDQVVVLWQTKEVSKDSVRYGVTPFDLTETLGENTASAKHRIQLVGLKPGTRYYYQVDSSGLDTVVNHFYTAPDKAETPVRIWAIGDSGQPGKIVNQVRDAMSAWSRENLLHGRSDIDVWLTLGDMAYRSGTNEQFQRGFFKPYQSILKNTAVWPALGNHDDRRWTYFRVFELPQNGEIGGFASGSEYYYSIDYADVHFVVLDSQSSNNDADSEMVVWLKRDLAQNHKKWLVVTFHHPPYTKGSHDSDNEGDSNGRMQEMRENVLPILEKAGADVVLSGHSHMYERSHLVDCHYGVSSTFTSSNIVSIGTEQKNRHYLKPLTASKNSGTIYVVAGSASKVDIGPLDHPVNVVAYQEAGSVVIDIDNNMLTSRFINLNGIELDNFTITKEEGFKPDYSGCDL